MVKNKVTRRTQPKKCLQTVCGMTCIKTGYKCKDKDPKSKENVKNKTKNLVRQLGNKAWVAQGRAKNKARKAIGEVKNKAWVTQGRFKNKTKSLIKKVKKNFNLLKDKTWVNANIVRRKFNEGLKRAVSSIINKIKRVATVLKQEGTAGVKNRVWLARSQAKANVKKILSKLDNKKQLATTQVKSKVLRPLNNLGNNVWYLKNRRRYQFS
ncbi:MAG: hypothetical protein ACRDBG_26020 [Waterburya sp.]